MPTVQFGKRPGRTRGRPAAKGTADGSAVVRYAPAPATEGVDVVAAVQAVTQDATGGTYTLSLDAQESGNLAYDITKAALNTALELMSNIANVTIGGTDGGPYTVQFDDGLGPTSLLVADDTNLTGETVGTTVTENIVGVLNVFEAFTLVTEGDTGVFTITIDGNESGDIDADDDADALEILVEGITGITAVECTGLGTRKEPFLVTFATPAGNVDVAITDVTGWSSTVVAADRQVAPGDRG